MTANTLWWQNSDERIATAKHENIGSRPPVKESDSCTEADLILPESETPFLAPNVGGDVGDPSREEEFKHFERYTNGNSPTNSRLCSISFHDSYEQQPLLSDYSAPNSSQVPCR